MPKPNSKASAKSSRRRRERRKEFREGILARHAELSDMICHQEKELADIKDEIFLLSTANLIFVNCKKTK